MSDTLILQSHRFPLPFAWLGTCLESVQAWAQANHFDYEFLGDELFDFVPEHLMQKTSNQKVIASDLARLRILQNRLQGGYQTAIWCDADFIIFDPGLFKLPDTDYALGREVWVQRDRKGRFKTYSRVHNAFLMFRQGNNFLDFYADTAQRLLSLNQGNMPPQFIGPKLLSAIHNIALCPVMESAGMLSPLVIRDLLNGEGQALDLFRKNSPEPLYAVNLCSSLIAGESISDADMSGLISRLVSSGI